MHSPVVPELVIPVQTREFLKNARLEGGLLVLGAGILQLPAIRLGKMLGLTVYVADANASAPGALEADGFICASIHDSEAVIPAAKPLVEAGEIQAVMTVGTDFSLTVAKVAAEFGFPGNTPEAAEKASRKHLMRREFAAAGLSSPAAVSVDATELQSVSSNTSRIPELSKLKYPLVVKPSDSMGARGVAMVRSEADLAPAITAASKHSRNGICIVEEFIEGIEYSLDALYQDGVLYPAGIARRHIDYPPYFIERGHDFPSGLTPEQESRMFKLLSEAASVLGLDNSAVKGDMFWGPDGPVIGEVAARLSGGFMSGWTYPMSSGLHPVIGAIFLAFGQMLPEEFRRAGQSNAVSERGLLSIPGTIEAIELPEPPEGAVYSVTVKPGDTVRFPRNNVEKCGNLISTGLSASAEQLIASTQIILEPWSLEQVSKSLITSEEAASFDDSHHGDDLHPLPYFPIAFPDLYSAYCCDTEQPLPPHQNWRLELPANILNHHERDWAYRTVTQSLEMLRKRHPQLEVALLPVSQSEETHSPRRATCQPLLRCLLRGGIQLADLYIRSAGVEPVKMASAKATKADTVKAESR